MQKLKEYLPLVEQEIEASIERMPQEFAVKELYQPIEYILSIGGKRLRPALVLLGANLFNDNIANAVKPAVAIEVFHNFTLLHDDIMDKAPMRRGKETVHIKWNENVAILSGDAMMINAYDFLQDLTPELFKPVFEVFNRTALEVCIGQQYDMNFETRNTVSVDEYIEMIRLKTSVLIASALKIGGIIGGATTQEQNALYNYGQNLGLAFQMHDDILDVYGDQSIFGKAIGGDIVANKKTFMLIKALQLATGETKQQLNDWLNKKEFDREEKVTAIKAIYEKLNIREKTEQMREEFYQKALNEIAQINDNNGRLHYLNEFAEWLMKRNK